MQIIYALEYPTAIHLPQSQKQLHLNCQKLYDLYLTLLSLCTEIHYKALNHLTKSKQKHLATLADKNPNTKFVNNGLLLQLVNNKVLQKTINNKKLKFWVLDSEYVDILFKNIIQSKLYAQYMNTTTASYYEDKQFFTEVFKTIIAPNQKLYEYLEDKQITWLDDFALVNTFIVKRFNSLKINSLDQVMLPDLYRDSDDKVFGSQLLELTLKNLEIFKEEIALKTKNWDNDRIAKIDFVLLLMAICELKKFPTIPAKASINEYLEIAKEYSTPKSSFFINGILDNLLKEYNDKGTLNKVGRGLL